MTTITNDPSKLGILVLTIYFNNKRAELDVNNGWKMLCLDGTFQIKQDIITNETVTMNVHRIVRRKNVC